jgi:hypothetical protein
MALPASAQEAPESAPGPAQAQAQGGTRRAVILCGLSGDAEHREQFAASIESLYAGLTTHHGFAAGNVLVLWGDEPVETDGPAVKSSRGVLARESLNSELGALTAEIQPDDALWVFVFGHAHYDGRNSWLNIAGDDVHQGELAKLFSGLTCREQVFFITTAASGFYTKPLAAPGRIVITATEPDLEVNETIFSHKLCRALGPTPPAYAELDVDRDWRLSLLDVFLWSARETASEYAGLMLLATEHALIDDTGDGRGTELQIQYLPEELGGRLRAGTQWPGPPKGDGARARRLLLAWPPSPPVPPEALGE